MKLKNLKIGVKDERGEEILNVYMKYEEYGIYRTKTGVLTKFCENKNQCRVLRKRFSEIGPLFSSVSALQASFVSNTKGINKEIARAISQCLEGNPDNSERILVKVEKRLIKLANIRGRLHYQLGGIAVISIIMIILFFVYSVPIFNAGNPFDSLTLFKVAACGALGGFLSVAIGIKKLEIDADSYWMMNATTGGSRILIAIASGLLIYFAVSSKLIMGNLSLSDDIFQYTIYTLSIAAGFSESFVPNILPRILDGKSH